MDYDTDHWIHLAITLLIKLYQANFNLKHDNWFCTCTGYTCTDL